METSQQRTEEIVPQMTDESRLVTLPLPDAQDLDERAADTPAPRGDFQTQHHVPPGYQRLQTQAEDEIFFSYFRVDIADRVVARLETNRHVTWRKGVALFHKRTNKYVASAGLQDANHGPVEVSMQLQPGEHASDYELHLSKAKFLGIPVVMYRLPLDFVAYRFGLHFLWHRDS